MLHSLLVHFPIALLTAGFIADVLGRLRKDERMSVVGWWNTVAGSAGLLAAIGSGLLARDRLPTLDALTAATMTAHEERAFAVTVLFLALTGWRIASRPSLPHRLPGLYLAVAAAGIVLLWLTAHAGGELVHVFGIRVIDPAGP